MEMKPYYTAYENRYQKVYEAGAERLGHLPDDEELVSTLTAWVEKNQLKGKRIIEFAYGEGGAPMLFFRESYRINAYDGQVASFDDWLDITGVDYETLGQRFVKSDNNAIEVYIPLLPACAKAQEGYMRE